MKQALHLLNRLRFGGAENVALSYARLMAEWGVVSIVCGKRDSVDFERHASSCAIVRPGFSLREVRRSGIIFIHSNRNLLKLFLFRPFFRRKEKQVVYIQHLAYTVRKFRLVAPLINILCTGFIRITPVTESLVERYIRIPTAFVPNFYRPRYAFTARAEVRRTIREGHAIPEDKILILFTGVLRAGKGLGNFLDLAARFTGDGRYLFVVVGDGEEAGKIRAYTGGNLFWASWQADVEAWLLASDAYCFFSRKEMMPMALVEALTLGVPVVAFASPVNDFLLAGQTYTGTDEAERTIRSGYIPRVPLSAGIKYAAGELKRLLRYDIPKKLLHIQVMPKMTGVQRVSSEIFRCLAHGEYESTILFGHPDTPYTDDCLHHFQALGVRVLRSNNLCREIGLNDLRAFREIYRLCRKERFDIVHTHSTKPGIIGRLAARLAGVPLVVHTVHGVAFHRYVPLVKRVFYYGVEQLACCFSHRIVLVSGYYRRFYGLFWRKVSVIPNGISVLPEKTGPKIQSDSGPIRLLFVGRLEPAKDPLTLLRVMDLLVNRYGRKEFRLTLVGDGELEACCRSYIWENGLADRVTMAGWQANVTPFYRDHRIFCLSSIHEAFGLCLLESGLNGLPAVSTRVGGIPEVVREGETGLLVPPRDPEAMALAILRLADDPLLCRRMGAAARKRVTEYFTAEKMAAEYRRIYRKEL